MSTSVVQNAFQALASSDPDRISAAFTEDAEWLSPPENPTAVAIAVHGLNAGGDRVTVEPTLTSLSR